MTNILYALMLNQNIIDERILITLRNDINYTKKLNTEKWSQTMTFLIFEGSWHVVRRCTQSLKINKLIVELIIN